MRKRKKKFCWTVSEKMEVVRARRSGLTLEEIKNLYGAGASAVSRWQRSYEEHGLVGLENIGFKEEGKREVGPKTRAAEELLEEVKPLEPNAGVGKMQGALYRKGFLRLARETVRRILRGQGIKPLRYKNSRRNKPKEVRHFERANPNELWQTDIMTFMLKGQYRVYLIGFMDDNSRMIVGWGLYRFQTSANVQEVFRAALEKHGAPKEILSDNGRQYYTWRGKSKFTQMLLKLGIRHIRSRPYHPQTLGKIESFWRNLFQECLSQLPLQSFEEAKEKIGEYIEYYNFKRPHQGIGNLVPSDRYYRVDGQVKQIIEDNSAKVGESQTMGLEYQRPAYLVGNLGGKELRVIAKDAQVSLEERGSEVVQSDHTEERPPEEDRRVEDELRETSKGPESSKSTGEIGAGSIGDEPETIHRESVPRVRDLAGAILPVGSQDPGSGLEGSGSQSSGAKTDPAEGGSPRENSEDAGETGTPRERESGAAEGSGPLERGGSVRTENYPATGVGAVLGGRA